MNASIDVIISDKKSFVELFIVDYPRSDGFVRFGFPIDGVPLMSEAKEVSNSQRNLPLAGTTWVDP